MYLDKIFKILDDELDLVIKECSDKELLYELGLLKTESKETYSTLIKRHYNTVLNTKYKEVYEKTLKAIEYIKHKNDNSLIMIDYLSEIYTNILNYSEIIINNKVV